MPENQEKRWEEFRACLILRHTPRLGAKSWQRLVKHFGSATAALAEKKDWVLLGLTGREQAENEVNSVAFRKEMDLVQKGGLQFILYSDEDYPALLREINTPPLVLYYLGQRGLLQNPAVAVVGSRNCSAYGVRIAGEICRGLSASGVSIVSGMAYGIDKQAHIGGLSGPGKSIAVLGTGIDIVYPSANRDIAEQLAQDGLVLSEFAPGTPPDSHNFPVRNRIVSGLCLGVVVIQAALKSGSMVTARLALEQGRDVFAVPGPVDQKNFEGCNWLIRQGAVLTRNAEDILLEIAPHLHSFVCEEKTESRNENLYAGLDTKQVQIIKCLQDGEELHIDELRRELGWEGQELLTCLLELEMTGRVSRLPGAKYTLG